ncbi:patatin-like phospholipase family protein [Actinokineospora sp. HUAS TT18]|uniref:patatin-like phospholipase family protein n=1 Tax=Actinokineospora sp. HUAS TT18 TaxID=3447451 RepID=UPI003F51D122
MRRGLVIGCGGTVGGAWEVGALAALSDALDWDPRTAEVIVGSSSGSSLAAMLGAGVGVAELVAGQRADSSARESVRRFFTTPPARLPRLPLGPPTSLRLTRAGFRSRSWLAGLSGLAPRGRTDAGFLDRLIDDLAADGWVPHPRTWIVTIDAATGARVAFGSPDAPTAPLRDAVRASWAVPGWYPPVTIGGRRYLDGGVASPTSADLVADLDLDEVVIISPMASVDGARVPGLGGRAENLMRRSMTRTLAAEVTLLRAKGVRVIQVHPTTAELSRMGFNFMDPRRRLPALDAALTAIPARLGDLEVHP